MTSRIHRARTVEDLRRLLDGDPDREPQVGTRADAYRFMERTVRRFDYFRLAKSDKSVLRRFLGRMTGLSRSQITRLLKQYRATGHLADHRRATPRSFRPRYTGADIERLAEVDALHGTLPGPTARKLCARAYGLFGDRRFERLAGISNAHLYNLRRSAAYRRHREATPGPTCPVPLASRERWRPRLFGLPGHLRVVGVQHGAGGLHYFNLVDEVTRFQSVGSVDTLDAACLADILDDLLRTFPFTPRGFHPGRYASRDERRLAALLNTLSVDAPSPGTGARPHGHAAQVNAFIRQALAPYLNYHRLCCFPSDRVDADGRLRRRCRDADIMTPYDRLKSVPGAGACLTPGTTFAELDALASSISDNEAARALAAAGARLSPPE